MALTLHHATPTQLVNRMRERFKDATREEVWRLAALLKTRYDAGDFTALQLRTAFGMTITQFNSFVTRVNALAAKWTDLKAAQGE